ncbi:hypothetical protein [Listeria fleischmannii]|uniref:Uncharacterized protein n=1 Tax=Listeria fleischmannii FSL S10-1203 TaxID=1265822 RepID=W7D5B3_9LIST|nr:hypothetical protein [Listeria fleischmannii]EUJ44185.1 hypothetical protein MCOL2_20011 [Listeria fleischmannii FSL S10-1203]
MAEIEIRALDRKMTDVVPIIREQAIATLQCTIYNSYETQDLSRMEAFKEELLKRYDMTYTDVERALDLNQVTWG